MDLSVFDRTPRAGYLGRAIPDPRDAGLRELVGAVTSPEGYRELGAALSEDAHWPALRVFAERMADLAVRIGDAGPLSDALVALSLGGLAVGEREAMLVAPLVYRAAELIGADPDAAFREAGRRVDDRARAQLDLFLTRKDKSIGSMGYVESSDDDGFRFHRTW